MSKARLSQAVVHQATVLSVMKHSDPNHEFKLHEIRDSLKCPDAYPLSGRLRSMYRDKKIDQGEPYKSPTNNQITNTYVVTDVGRAYLKAHLTDVQIIGEYDIETGYINKGREKKPDLFTPQSAGLGALGEVISETESMINLLKHLRSSLSAYVEQPSTTED